MHSSFLLPSSPVDSLATYVERGGGRGWARAQELGPAGTIQEVLLSGLRGRGGAGFPTGRKWLSVRGDGGPDAGDRYVVCNGAEGEPGTFKDRAILRADPYQVVEGMAIAAFAMGAREAYIAVKGSFAPEIAALERALAEMAEAGLTGDAPLTLIAGPEEYLFGEETGMLQVIEGDAPLPRLLPPYLHGLYATTPNEGWSARPTDAHPRTTFDASNPTLVNNVETLANVTHVLTHGPEWHRSLGTPRSPGVVVCTVVGDVVSPGVQEIELGTPLREVIEKVGGGVRSGRAVKAVFSGVSNPVVTGDQLDVPVSYEGMEAIGSGLGSAGFVVYDDTTSMVEVAHIVSQFLYVESCGQCPACKLGTGEITHQLAGLTAGKADADAIEVIGARLRSVTDGNRCYLPVEEQRVVASLLRAFPEEFLDAEEGTPVARRGLLVPKLIDVNSAGAVLDERQARKRPDWTYAD
ncbi:MAG: NADH-quinone oxidoreductase subunit [Acidimicrobiaceae bacterium]